MCLLDPPVLCLWPSSGAVVAWSLDFVALGHSRWAVPGGSVNGGISVIIHFNWMFSINHPLGVSPSMETHPPKWMVYFMERSRSKMDDDWGGTPFSEDSSKSRKCMNSKKHLLVLITQGTLTIIVVWWFDIVWFQLLCDLRRIWGSRQRGSGWRIDHPGVHGDTIRIIMEYITKNMNIYIYIYMWIILWHLARSWWNMVKYGEMSTSRGICWNLFWSPDSFMFICRDDPEGIIVLFCLLACIGLPCVERDFNSRQQQAQAEAANPRGQVVQMA